MDVERHNLTQIAGLNQRGGRTLSIVDLIEDGTITPDMAALCWLAVECGTSFLTGAVPGGVGKTTLMGSILSFLPPGERIVTVADRPVIEDALAGRIQTPATALAHEIGSGHLFGYIWGRNAADFFSLWRRGIRCVSCLHADTPEQTWDSLQSLGATDEDLGHIGLQLFMCIAGGRLRPLRRVSSLHCRLEDSLRLVYRWEQEGDRFEPALARGQVCELLGAQHGLSAAEVDERWTDRRRCLDEVCREQIRPFAAVRERIVGSYGA